MQQPVGKLKIISCYSITKGVDKENFANEVAKFVNSIKGQTAGSGIEITWLCPDAQTMHCVIGWSVYEDH